MEQRAGDAGRDSDQCSLALKNFYLTGRREVGKIDGASAANAEGGGLVGSHGRKGRQKLARVNEEVSDGALNSRFLHVAYLALRESEASAGMKSCFLWSGFLKTDFVTFDFFDGVSLGDIEFGDGSAAQSFEMGSAAEALAHFVCDGTHVGTGSDAGAKLGAVGFDGADHEFLDFDFHCVQDDLLLFSRQLVSGDAMDFFGGERRRDLLDDADELRREFL